MAEENLASKNDIANFIKKTEFDVQVKDLNIKSTSNKTKRVLVENEFKKLQTFEVFLSVKVTSKVMEHKFI